MKKTTSPPRPKAVTETAPKPKPKPEERAVTSTASKPKPDAEEITPRPSKAAGNGARLNGDRLDEKQLLAALSAFRRGDFSVRLPDDWVGLAGKIADTFNEVIGMNQRLARELERIGQVVGKEGR